MVVLHAEAAQAGITVCDLMYTPGQHQFLHRISGQWIKEWLGVITQTGFMATMSAAVMGSTLPQNGAVGFSISIGQDGRGKGSLRVKMVGSVA